MYSKSALSIWQLIWNQIQYNMFLLIYLKNDGPLTEFPLWTLFHFDEKNW